MGDFRHQSVGGSEGPTNLREAVLYEDFRSGVRGRQFAEALAHRIGSECLLETSLWRLDLLSERVFAHEAAITAATSDYLLVVLHGDRVPGAAARSWFRQLLPRAVEGGTSVILLSCAEAGTRRALEPSRHFLRHHCAQHDVPFFCLATNPASATDTSPTVTDEAPVALLCP